jgi:long-chain acyl-CoA synthetase
MNERPWLESYPADLPKTLEPYPRESVFWMLSRSATRFPDRPALAFFGKHLSYREMLTEVERFSAVLTSLGVTRGDRVGLLLPNCPQYAIAYYATVRLGGIVVGNNPLYTKPELAHQLADAGCRVLITLDLFYRLVTEVREETPVAELVVTKLTDYMPAHLALLAPIRFKKEAREHGRPWPPVPKGESVLWWRQAMHADRPIPPVASVDPAADVGGLIYTGGTTGSSKGAMLTHTNIVANAMQGASWFPGVGDGTDALLAILPYFHAFGMLAMNVAVLKAAKLISLPRFDLKQVLRTISKEKPSLLPGVPRMYIALNESPETSKFDLRSIEACVSGAAPLPVAVADRFREVTGGGEVVEGYGLTECSPVTHANPFSGLRKAGSIGLPMPDTDCKIVSTDDADLIQPPGHSGELCIRGPQVMKGYWNRSEETANVLRNGWLHSGDIATMDDDGYFYIVDRLKDLILVSGFNVFPTEVEQVLYRHPKIEKVCVAGVPDDTTGEAVKAFAVLRRGASATAEEIVAWCREPEQGLTGYRVPKQIEFRDSLPETMVGKVLRRVLQAEERERRETESLEPKT